MDREMSLLTGRQVSLVKLKLRVQRTLTAQKEDNSVFKWAKDVNGHFTKDNVYKQPTSMWKCSQ